MHRFNDKNPPPFVVAKAIILISFVLHLGLDPDQEEDEAEDSGGEKTEDMADYLNDPDFQNMSDSEGDDLPLFQVYLTCLAQIVLNPGLGSRSRPFLAQLEPEPAPDQA